MIGSDSIWLSKLVPLDQNYVFAPLRQSSGIEGYRASSRSRMLKRPADCVGVGQIFFEALLRLPPKEALVVKQSINTVSRRSTGDRALSALFGTRQVQAVQWLAK